MQDLLLVNLAQGLPVSTVVFGVAVTLPREPTCPGKRWYQWLCGWVTAPDEGPPDSGCSVH